MKNKLQLNHKISLKQKLVYASLGVGIVAALSVLGFLYLNLGSSEKVMAAGGHEPCTTTFYSADGNSITITVEAMRFSQLVCHATSYDYKIDFEYEIAFSGTVDPIIYDLKGFFSYEGGSFEFPMNTRTEGTHTTTSYGATVLNKDCATASLGSISNMQIFIKSDGITEKTSQCSEILLPISLLDFNANKNGETIALDWTTGTEIDNDFFTLEHSVDGKVFEHIATIEGAGNSTQIIDYQFEDKTPAQGMNYYRLKQTDYNGDFEYFKIVGVNNTGAASESKVSNAIIIEEAYPNPFRGEIKLDFEVSKAENIEVIIQNARGEVLYIEVISAYAGANNYTFTKADELKSGIYYINLKSNSEQFKPQRIVKL